MDRKIVIIVLWVLSFLTFACRHKQEFKGETASVDSLVALLNKSVSSVEKALEEQAEEAGEKAKELLSEIQKLIHDTLSKKTALLIGQYANITEEENEQEEKNSNFSGREKEFIIRELKYSIKQLQNLIHDLQNGNMTAENFNKHLSEERKASERIIQVAEMRCFRWMQMTELRDSLEPAILHIRDSLKNSSK